MGGGRTSWRRLSGVVSFECFYSLSLPINILSNFRNFGTSELQELRGLLNFRNFGNFGNYGTTGTSELQ
jgi:hypothetical protein